MTPKDIDNLRPDPAGIDKAVAYLRAGDLVAFPTETVYGLGADATNDEAVATVFSAKGRPSFNPLIVHVANIDAARALAKWNDAADTLAQAFWPGPLTLVLPLVPGHGLSPQVTGGLDTIAIRAPAHPAARSLLSAFKLPIAAPSANPSGRISPTQADHVKEGLNGKIAAVLDDGPCPVGLESTIIDAVNLTLLRPGGVNVEQIEAVLGRPTAQRQTQDITAPGQLASHYAPNVKMRLNVETPNPGEAFLGFGLMDCDINLSAKGDLTEAASQLFEALHLLDKEGRTIAVAPIPEVGLGIPINDRLRRAAAPR